MFTKHIPYCIKIAYTPSTGPARSREFRPELLFFNEFHRRQIPQRIVRPFLVVFSSPRFDFLSCIVHIHEPVHRQTFIPKFYPKKQKARRHRAFVLLYVGFLGDRGVEPLTSTMKIYWTLIIYPSIDFDSD